MIGGGHCQSALPGSRVGRSGGHSLGGVVVVVAAGGKQWPYRDGKTGTGRYGWGERRWNVAEGLEILG